MKKERRQCQHGAQAEMHRGARGGQDLRRNGAIPASRLSGLQGRLAELAAGNKKCYLFGGISRGTFSRLREARFLGYVECLTIAFSSDQAMGCAKGFVVIQCYKEGLKRMAQQMERLPRAYARKKVKFLLTAGGCVV